MSDDGFTRDLVLIGGGEHATVVADAARAAGWRLIGYADPAPSPAMTGLQIDHLGSDSEARAVVGDAFGVIAVGGSANLDFRRDLVGRWGSQRWAIVIHPAAVVSRHARLEAGSVVLAGAIVNPGAHVGAHAIVNSGAVVEHDVAVGPFSHIAPGAVIGGGSLIGEGVLIGLGARVRDHISIGDGATVGMGAVVVESVGTGAMVMGVPARMASPERQHRPRR